MPGVRCGHSQQDYPPHFELVERQPVLVQHSAQWAYCGLFVDATHQRSCATTAPLSGGIVAASANQVSLNAPLLTFYDGEREKKWDGFQLGGKPCNQLCTSIFLNCGNDPVLSPIPAPICSVWCSSTNAREIRGVWVIGRQHARVVHVVQRQVPIVEVEEFGLVLTKL